MREIVRKIAAQAVNLVARALIDRPDPDGSFAQIQGLSGRVTPEVEVFQPQGLHFQLPIGAEGIAVAPQGEFDNVVMTSVSDRSSLPILPLAPGEGGLHYLGTYKVFLNFDGTVSLGDKLAVDYVALASLVTAQLAAIKAAFDAHTHTSACTAGGAVTAPPAAPMPAPGPVAATLVKAL